MTKLRNYQQKAVDEIRAHFSADRKAVLYEAPCGAGKTTVFNYIMDEMRANGKRCLLAVRMRKLVQQTSARLDRDGIPHGVLMAGYPVTNELIQIASIDTLNAREMYPKADLVVIDEAHWSVSETFIHFCNQYKNTYMLSVTATPYPEKKLIHIVRHDPSAVVKTASMADLIKLGYLVPAKIYSPKSDIDLDKAKVSNSTKDYVVDDIENIMIDNVIVGDTVEQYIKYGQNRSALVFAVTIRHSQSLCLKFNSAGIKCAHLDADSPDDHRANVIKKIENGEIKVIVNVGIMGTGVDIPSLGCVVMARPTKSLCLYQQQAGRGTRVSPGKKDFILIDQVGNSLRHGFVDDDHPVSLYGNRKTTKNEAKQCPQCFKIIRKFPCDECGYGQQIIDEENAKIAKLKQIEGELEERKKTERTKYINYLQVSNKRLAEIVEECVNNKRKVGWMFHVIKAEFGLGKVFDFYRQAKRALPPGYESLVGDRESGKISSVEK